MPQETADRKRVTALGQLFGRHLNGLDEFSIERPLAFAVTLGTRLPVTPQIRATLRALDQSQLCLRLCLDHRLGKPNLHAKRFALILLWSQTKFWRQGLPPLAFCLGVPIEDNGLLHWLLLCSGQLTSKPTTVHVGLPGQQVNIVVLANAN